MEKQQHGPAPTEDSHDMSSEHGASETSGWRPLSQEDSADHTAKEEDDKIEKPRFDVFISQPTDLMLVKSAEAATEVLEGGTLSTDDEIEDAEHEYVTGIRLVLTNSALVLSSILMFLDTSILSTAIPTITNEFHSTADIGWYVSSYQLALSVLQPTTGKLFTYLPNKWTYIAFLVVFELGSLICALANSSGMFISGRIVSGLGASGLFNGALTIVAALVPLRKRPAMNGILLGFSQLGLIGGPLIGGSLTQYTTWRWCFWINIPVGGLAILTLILVHIPEQHHKAPIRSFLRSPGLARKFDLGGALILAPGVAMLLLALQFGGNAHPWASATVIGLFAGFSAMAALFITWEWRIARTDGMLPLALFRNRVVVAACLTTICVFGSTAIAVYFLPIYFQSIQGSSPFDSGLYMLPSILSQILMSVISGVGVSKLGYYLPWAVCASIVMSIGSGLIATWSTTTGIGQWIGYQVILGAGRGTALQQGMVALQTVLPDSQVAVGLAMMMFLQGLMGSILINIANTVFDNSLLSEIRSKAPGVNAEAVLAAGATAFRQVVSPEQLPSVLEAYAISFDRVFYLVIGLTGAMFITSCGLGWHDVREKKLKTDAVAPDVQSKDGQGRRMSEA